MSEELDDGFVVRARGLPWSSTADDVIAFFSDSNIVGGKDGVKFTYVSGGRPTGECFVTLASQEDVKKALEKNNNHIGHRYIEVFQSKNSEMEWVTKRSGSDSKVLEENDGCVRLRGLPFDCTTEDIAEFFQGHEIMADGITLPTDYDGRSTGEAFVQFATKDIAESAITSKHKSNMGHRYIEIFRCNSADIRRFNSNPMRFRQGGFGMNRPGPYDRSGTGMGASRGRSRNSGFERRYGGGGGYGGYGYNDDFNYGFGGYGGYSSGGRGGRGRGTSGPGRGGWGGGPQPLLPRGDFKRGFGGGMGGGGMSGGYGSGGGGGGDFDTCTGFWIHMRGLPFKATEEDIHAFFGSAATPVNIKIHRVNGRATGEADADFESLEAAQAAMTKDKQDIGNRYIELFLNKNESIASSGGGSGFGSGRNGGGGGGGYSGDYSGGQSSFTGTGGSGGGYSSSNMGNMGGGYSSYGSGGGYGSQGMGTGGNQSNFYGSSGGGGGGTTGTGMGMGMNNSNNYGGGY